MNAPHEADVLFFVRDGKPVLDELDARAHQHLLELRNRAEKFFVLLIRAKSHDALDTGPVVPAAVKQDDLAGARQMRHIALEIPLGLLARVRRGQGGDPADARVEALRDAFDDATFAGGIASFKQNNHFVPGLDHPILQFHEFCLHPEQLPEVLTPALLVL